MDKHLYLVTTNLFKAGEHDIRLPKLGLMKFKICDGDEGAVYIMYFKSKDYVEGPVTNPLSDDLSDRPYCYAKVKLNEIEKTLHRELYDKLVKKINKLRAWLIQQDVLLSQIQSTCREVKL